MLTIAGSVTIKVMIVPLSVRFPLKKKSSLDILKDLMIVICGPKLYEDTAPIIIPAQDRIIMVMSKMFQESLKNRSE